MDFYYSEDPPLNQWNTYFPSEAPSAYVSYHPFSYFPGSDLSNPSSQPPVNLNVLENQSSTTSGIQCLWGTTDGKICNHWCQNPEDLALHIKDTHIPRKGKFVCHWKGCDRQGKSFGIRNNLVEHLRVHTKETPFKCDVCEKRFATTFNLRRHRRIHTGEKPYLCPEEGCSKRFSNSADCMSHMQTHRKKKSFVCKHCDRKYSQLSSLRKHFKDNHEKESVGSSGSGALLIDTSRILQTSVPEYHNLVDTSSYPVGYPGFNDPRDQVDRYPYVDYTHYQM